jgi:DNA-binding PadR family transcriptional regulator
MSQELSEYLSTYIQSRVGVFKKYLLAALENKDQSIWYLESSEGMLVPSSDLKNLQLLRDAQLFTEDTRISRNGRNTYKIYCLTELGRKLATEIKKEGLEGIKQEKTP